MTSYPGEPPEPAAHPAAHRAAGAAAYQGGNTDPRLPTVTFQVEHGYVAGFSPHDRHHEGAVYYPGGAEADPSPLYGPAGGDDDRLWAMMSYLGVIFFAFLPPLAVYLAKRRESPYVRYHAAQALNLWLTVFLYAISFLIIGGVLALDNLSTALAIGLPLIAAAGTAMLWYAVRAALAANRGSLYRIPSWICVVMAK